MATIKVGMLGIGTVGQGTFRVLTMNYDKILASTGLDIQITKIYNRHPELDRGVDVPEGVYTTDVNDILKNPDIDIVVELIGGVEPASTFIKTALENGKSVVTANKAVIAARGQELAQIAMDHHVLLRFEAAVCGGIPIITSITTALLSNHFEELQGILNGTTNFILTKMEEEGLSYQEALGMAQEKGFAEADPTADVDGLDAANKLSILISLVFEISAPPAQIPTRGISNVSSIDMDFASEMDFRIKMLASAKEENGKVYAAVSPALVPVDHPLASVANEFNAVFLTGNAVDDLMFYGRGAGAMPTGSAVVGDVIGVARKFEKDSDYDLVPQLRYDGGLDFAGEGSGRYYVRMTAPDQPGVLGRITTILGWHNISIDTVVQRPQKKAKGQSSTAPGSATLLFIFQKAEKKVIDRALSEILLDKAVTSVENVMRVVEE